MVSPVKRIRILLTEPDAPLPAASVWAKAQEAGAKVAVELEHSYPDLKPGVGWTVSGRNLAAVVESVSGKVLTCVRS